MLTNAQQLGWDAAQLHAESFGGEPLDHDADSGFVVRLARSGREVAVAPAQSIVEALRAVGVRIETSCEQGVCGTCRTGVLDGMPDHRDMFLLPDEKERNDQFLPCCSRSRSPVLVLDL